MTKVGQQMNLHGDVHMTRESEEVVTMTCVTIVTYYLVNISLRCPHTKYSTPTVKLTQQEQSSWSTDLRNFNMTQETTTTRQ